MKIACSVLGDAAGDSLAPARGQKVPFWHILLDPSSVKTPRF